MKVRTILAQLTRLGATFSAILLLAICAGCGAPAAPIELKDARQSYANAKNGPAAQLAPGDVLEAKKILDMAEEAYEEAPRAGYTRDLAYIADRRARLAHVRARIEKLNRLKKRTEEDYRDSTEVELAKLRAQAGVSELASLPGAKKSKRGLVITLSGSILFPSGEWTLLPAARKRLTGVAKALKANGSPRVIVEGHTDSSGSPSINRRLSKLRADAVRFHLVKQGLSPHRIKARGMGPARPVATNRTAEGRANNRRVELIIE